MTKPSTANRTTHNPSTTVIHAAAPAKPRANGDKTSHAPSKKLAASCQCRMRMTLTSLLLLYGNALMAMRGADRRRESRMSGAGRQPLKRISPGANVLLAIWGNRSRDDRDVRHDGFRVQD